MCGFRNLPGEAIWRIQIYGSRYVPGSSSVLQWRSEIYKTLPGSFDLSSLATGESLPLCQSCGTEIAVCKVAVLFAYQVSLRF
jgi:hypothetical protein